MSIWTSTCECCGSQPAEAGASAVGQLHFVADAGVRGFMIGPLSLFGTLAQ